MTKERLNILLDAYLSDQLSEGERQELSAAMGEQENAEQVKAFIEQCLETRVFNYDPDLSGFNARLLASIKQPTKVRKMQWWKYAAAAVVIAVMVFTGKQFFNKEKPITASVYHNDVAPGKPGAKLKLSNGRVIELDSVKDGLIAMEGGLQVYKQNGEIIYMGDADAGAGVLYNELVADKKQTSSARLPDGSIAWVNAESSVRYPVVFGGNERKVTMTGEAIFQVTHNEKQPFRVYVGDQVFEDLGTVFNINAYSDQSIIKTTVLEGSVKIKNTNIRPGQQAIVGKEGEVVLRAVDTEEVFAWRDGQFDFTGTSVEDILQQAARWYDVEIVYQSRINERFTISVNRDKPISQLLQQMELSGGVHFEIEGRKITVKP